MAIIVIGYNLSVLILSPTFSLKCCPCMLFNFQSKATDMIMSYNLIKEHCVGYS